MQQELLQQAIGHHQAGELQQAAVLYQQILASQPKHADANHLLGLIAHQCGNHEAAMQLVSTAATINPSNHIYLCNLGIIKIALQQWSDAITLLQGAIRLNPADVKAHTNLGVALEQKERFEEAVSSYENALAITPDDTEILIKLGNGYARLRRDEQATATLQRALQLNPESVETLNSLGILYKDIGQLDEAINYYRRAMNIAPERVEIHCNLAAALTSAAKLEEAERICKQALSIKPAYAEAYQQLTDNLHYQQRTSDWATTLDSALKKADLSADTRNHMLISKAIIHWMDGDLEQCKSALTKAESILTQPVTDKATYSALGYYKFLQALVTYRQKHPSRYEQCCESEIHIIGDSHCLSYANTTLLLDGKPHRVIPHLIMGCKAWHLSQAGANVCKTSLQLVLQKFNDGDKVIITFGEIDARPDEGIFPAHKKLGTDLVEATGSLADAFVQSILTMSSAKDLQLIFYGVPAPNCSLDHLPESDRETYLESVRLFNAALSSAATQASCRFLDTYHETVAETGIGNKRFHIDAFHLAPHFLGHLAGG